MAIKLWFLLSGMTANILMWLTVLLEQWSKYYCVDIRKLLTILLFKI